MDKSIDHDMDMTEGIIETAINQTLNREGLGFGMEGQGATQWRTTWNRHQVIKLEMDVCRVYRYMHMDICINY